MNEVGHRIDFSIGAAALLPPGYESLPFDEKIVVLNKCIASLNTCNKIPSDLFGRVSKMPSLDFLEGRNTKPQINTNDDDARSESSIGSDESEGWDEDSSEEDDISLKNASPTNTDKKEAKTDSAQQITAGSNLDPKYMGARNRMDKIQTSAPESRRRLQKTFGKQTEELLDRYALSLARDINSIGTSYLGMTKPKECVFGEMPGMGYTGYFLSNATSIPRWLGNTTDSLLEKCTGRKTQLCDEKAWSDYSQAQLGRALSDVLVVTTNQVGKKISDKLDNKDHDSDKKSEAKIDLVHKLCSRMKDFFDHFAEVQLSVTEKENPCELDMKRAQEFLKLEKEKVIREAPGELTKSQNQKLASRELFIEKLHENPKMIEYYDDYLAEKLTEKFLPGILDELPKGWGSLPSIIKILGGNSRLEPFLKSQVTNVLAIVLKGARGALVNEVALKNHLSNALSGANDSIRKIMQPSKNDGEQPTDKEIQERVKEVREEDVKLNDEGAASAVRSILTFVLGVKPSGFWNHNVLDNVFLKRFINKKIDTALKNCLKNEDQAVPFAHLLEAVFAGLNNGVFLEDGELSWTPGIKNWESVVKGEANPVSWRSEKWNNLTEEHKRKHRKDFNEMSPEHKAEYDKKEKVYVTDKLRNQIRNMGGLLADLSLSPETCFTGTLFIHYENVNRPDFIDEEQINKKAQEIGTALKGLSGKSPILKNSLQNLDWAKWARRSIVTMKKVDKYATWFFYHLYYSIKLNVAVNFIVSSFDWLIRDPIKRSVKESLSQNLNNGLESLSTSPLRHVLYNDVSEELFTNLGLLDDNEVVEIWNKVLEANPD